LEISASVYFYSQVTLIPLIARIGVRVHIDKRLLLHLAGEES